MNDFLINFLEKEIKLWIGCRFFIFKRWLVVRNIFDDSWSLRKFILRVKDKLIVYYVYIDWFLFLNLYI